MEIQKENEGEDFITCEECTKQCFEVDKMRKDNNDNWICSECDQKKYNFFFMDEPEENRESRNQKNKVKI